MKPPSVALPIRALPILIHTLLTDPACYDHPVQKLELIETHISWVILTGAYAYKIKKPVALGFLDFSTLELRHQDCLDELRLNRRLAADYYLDVVSITGSFDAPRINDAGSVLEYAVKIRQFPHDATLDKLAERGELHELHIDALAARLAHFHLAECEQASADSPWGEPEIIARPVRENFAILEKRLIEVEEIHRLNALQGWCIAEQARLAPLMCDRKRTGRVRECHGDLHLANLAWVDGKLVIFDCLEFSPSLRWIDVISEVAFCYMDLLHRQYPDLAARFLNAWLEKTGDYAGMPLLRYYAVYRALVRAKVAALRAEQGSGDSHSELASCLQLAEQLGKIASPKLLITHGLSGSGKTTLSQQLLQQQNLIRLRSDVERKRLAGLDALAISGAGVAKDLYAPSVSRSTYEHLTHLAERLLRSGWSVIVDAACLERWQRDLFRNLAQQYDVMFHILDIQVEPDSLRERVRARHIRGNDASEADLAVLQHQLDTVQPLGDDEMGLVMRATIQTGKIQHA